VRIAKFASHVTREDAGSQFCAHDGCMIVTGGWKLSRLYWGVGGGGEEIVAEGESDTTWNGEKERTEIKSE